MAKKRTIDIDALLFRVELVESLGPKGLLFYIMLWGHAEDWGGIRIDPGSLRLRMGAVSITTKEIEKYFTILINDLKKIVPYEIDGSGYGWIKSFLEHQYLKNPAMPNLPLPDWIVYEVKEYPSGKKYAEYTVITEKLPVDYQYTTSTTETIRNHKKLEETGRVLTSTSDFLKTLKETEAYRGLDIDRELKKMDGWLLANPQRKKTRKFVINWLNRALTEQPLEVSGTRFRKPC